MINKNNNISDILRQLEMTHDVTISDFHKSINDMKKLTIPFTSQTISYRIY